MSPGIPKIHQMHHATRSLRRLHSGFCQGANSLGVRFSTRLLYELLLLLLLLLLLEQGLGRAGAKISNERKQAKCCCCCAAAAASEAPEMGALLPLKCTGTTVVRSPRSPRVAPRRSGGGILSPRSPRVAPRRSGGGILEAAEAELPLVIRESYMLQSRWQSPGSLTRWHRGDGVRRWKP